MSWKWLGEWLKGLAGGGGQGARLQEANKEHFGRYECADGIEPRKGMPKSFPLMQKEPSGRTPPPPNENPQCRRSSPLRTRHHWIPATAPIVTSPVVAFAA